MVGTYSLELLWAVIATFQYYFSAWLLGTFIGIALAYLAWNLKAERSRYIYFAVTGASFIPVTVMIPYFLDAFGIRWFVYPLLALPVLLITFASCHESFQHANRHRQTLRVNYQQQGFHHFWTVVFRESVPALKTTFRQTLSLCFAIFIALDYFMEYWGGLGKIVHKYYTRLSFNEANYYFMTLSIVVTGLIGIVQVYINEKGFGRFVEFRKHY